MGINFNTRVSEGCRSQFGVCPPNSAGIIFNTRDVGESQSSREMHALK